MARVSDQALRRPDGKRKSIVRGSYVAGESRNLGFWDQRLRGELFRGFGLALDGDHRLQTAAVEEFHDQMDHALVVEAAVVMRLHR